MDAPLVRPAQKGDAEALLAIYAPYVRDTAITFEWEVPSLEEFAGRIEGIRRRYPYLVAERDGRVVGYAYASAFHERAAYDWCCENSIYVRQDERGSGVGRALYDELERELAARGFLNLYACIACPQQPDEHLGCESINFHTHVGYAVIGHFHSCGYKFGTWYDMVWMEKFIGAHDRPQPSVRFGP